jgi:hypothetical protein
VPSPTTALEIIEDALGLTNAVGTDQTLTADETSDCLRTLNDLIEDWNTQNLAVYGQANQTFNTVNGQATYTIGTGGNWNTVRPVRINEPAYSTINGVTFPMSAMSQGQYDLIAVKGQTQQFPDLFLYVNEFPLGLVTLWPTPNAVTPVTFSIDRLITAVSSAGASISFPPGYANAFVYNLAVKLGPKFGKKMSQYPEVVQEAKDSFGNIKRANKRPRVMSYDPAILNNGYTYADWMRGW